MLYIANCFHFHSFFEGEMHAWSGCMFLWRHCDVSTTILYYEIIGVSRNDEVKHTNCTVGGLYKL